MEFGYWKRQANGILKYYSLSRNIKQKILDDEQFWNIAQYDQWVIFQSLNQIFIYNTKSNSFNIIHPETGVNKVFTVNNTILYQTFGTGLFEIENGKSSLVSNDPELIKNKIINIYSQDDGLLIQTQYNGFLRCKDRQITNWAIDADVQLKATSI